MSTEDHIKRLLDRSLDPKSDLSDLLREVMALGAQLGSLELKQWAVNELRGYPAGEDLPDYRVVFGPITMDSISVSGIMTGQQISRTHLPDFAADELSEELRMVQPIKAIEELARLPEGDIKIGLPANAEIAAAMNQKQRDGHQVQRLYWRVSRISVESLLDQVRTRLVEFLSELGASPSLDRQHVQQAVSIVIHGNKNRVGHNLNPIIVTKSRWERFCDNTSAVVSTVSGLAVLIGILIGWLVTRS
jgi:hypothetical protein